MKKQPNSRITTIFSRIFDIPTWFDLARMKSFTLFLGSAFRLVFMGLQREDEFLTGTNDPALTESFDAAQKKLQLTDVDINTRRRSLLRWSYFMVLLALLILGYSGYSFVHASYKAGFLSMVVMLIALALAFRYHFWYYQFKTRQLGCSFHEWFRKGLLGENE
jgi:intracellular multiplication protein IcmV